MTENNEKSINSNMIHNTDTNIKSDEDKHTSLKAIALQYDSSNSDDDTNTEIVTKVSNDQYYRNKNEIVITSDESDDSESDSSTNSESNLESSIINCNKNDKNNSEDFELENQTKTKENGTKSVYKPKGEFDDLPPIEDLKISVPEVLCDPIGKVAWTAEQMVIVCPKPGKPTLNLDTVLFIEKGQRALGHIFDVFGQVTEPYYCVRFNSADHILECGITIGMIVYYCPNTTYTSVVFLNELIKMKGIDELGDDEPPQFSDDEEEKNYLASIKSKSTNNKVKEIDNGPPNKRRRDCQFKSMSKQNGQSKQYFNTNRKHNVEISTCSNNSKPFYNSQHPWARPKYPQQNIWHQHNTFSNNYWIPPNFSYNEMQSYDKYLCPVNEEEIGIQNTRFTPMHWNSHYQLPKMNMMPHQELPQTLVRPFTLPPPPPPPQLPSDQNINK